MTISCMQWWERSPPTNVARVQIPAPTHMWVEFVVGSLLCSERFFSGYSGFPLSSKTKSSKFQFDQESGRRRTTFKMCYPQIIIYLFIYILCCCLTHRNHCCCITRIINYLPLPIMIARAFNIVKLISS